MKITRKQLKRIINEELSRVSEDSGNTAQTAALCYGWHNCAERDIVYKLAKITDIDIGEGDGGDYAKNTLDSISSWAISEIQGKGIKGISRPQAYRKEIIDRLIPKKVAGSYMGYISDTLKLGIAIAKYSGRGDLQGRADHESERAWKSELEKLISKTEISHEGPKQRSGRPDKGGEKETRGEIQLDPNNPVPMSIDDAIKYARENGAPHLAFPDGDPNKRSEESLNWAMNGRGNREILLNLADMLDEAEVSAREKTIATAESDQLGINLGTEMGVFDRSEKYQQVFIELWRNKISPRIVKQIQNFKVYTFSNVLRDFAIGDGKYTRKIVFKEDAKGVVTLVKDAASDAWEAEGLDDTIAGLKAAGNKITTFLDVESTTFDGMVTALKQSTPTIAGIAFDGKIFDPDDGLNGMATPFGFGINAPMKAKEAIIGNPPTLEGLERLMVHEMDHLVYGMLWGASALLQGELHDVLHDGFEIDVIQALMNSPSAAFLARAHMKLEYPISKPLDDAAKIFDTRFKRNTKWIDMKLWSDPKHAFEVLSKREPSEIVQMRTSKGNVEVWLDYVFRIEAPEVSAAPQGRTVPGAIKGAADDAKPIADGGWVYMFGDGSATGNPSLDGSKGFARGDTSQGKGMHYISPQNAATASEIDARVVVTKDQMKDIGKENGFSGRYNLTPEDLRKLANMTYKEITDAGFSSNVAQTARILKPASEIDNKVADAFNGTGGSDEDPVAGDLYARVDESAYKMKTNEEFTVIRRGDGKTVIASDKVYKHIGTHSSLGKGSVFSGSVTKEMIDSFLESAQIPDGGGGISANFEGGGYLLVAPFNVAMQFKDAVVKVGSKEDFDPKQDKMVPVPVAEVHTSQPISDFATDITTALIFPYDPTRSSSQQNDFINNSEELSRDYSEGNLYALATAFPGGFDLDEVGGIKFPKVTVPRATAWGGLEDPKWAVIIPNDQSDKLIERWGRLAGLIK